MSNKERGSKKRKLRHIANWLFGFALCVSISTFGRTAALLLGIYNETIIFRSISRTEYEYTAETVFLPVWRNWKSGQVQGIWPILSVSFFTGLFLVGLMLAIQHYRHKAVRYASYAGLAAGVCMTAEALFLLIRKPYQAADIPSYEEQKIYTAYMQYSIQVYACVGAAVVLAALCMYGLSEKRKSRRNRD